MPLPPGVNSINLGGLNAICTGARSIVGGIYAKARGIGSVVIGGNASDGARGGTSDVVVGDGAMTGALGNTPENQAGAGEAVAVGPLAKTTSWRGLACGARAYAGAISASAFGWGARAMHVHGVALGRGAETSDDHQIVLGMHGSAPTHLHLNTSHTSRYMDGTYGGLIDRNPLLSPILIHGMSGLDTTPDPIQNRTGGDMVLAGGKSTGTAAGGKAALQVCPAGEVSGTSENPLVDALVAYPDRDVEVFKGVILSSADGARWRLTVSETGALEVNNLAAEPAGLFAIGDSKTDGDSWVATLTGMLGIPEITPRFGKSGYTMATMKPYIDANLAAVAGAPSIILINLGVNDTAVAMDETTWKNNFRSILTSLQAKWSYLSLIYVARVWKRNKETECNLIDQWIADVVPEYTGVYLGMDERIWLENGDNGVTNTTDGTHYNAAGDQACAEAWFATITGS